MARTRRARRLARCAPPDARNHRAGEPRLDSRGAGGMGGAMAPAMIPPDGTDEFLAQCGWAGSRVEPLAGDASFRRYFRVVGEGRQAVLMDAPPPHEDPRPFIAVAEWLGGVQITAPRIL